MLNTEQIWNALSVYAERYIRFGGVSIKANSHTHRMPHDATPPDKVVSNCILTFVKYCCQDEEFWSGQMSSQQVLDTLVGFARSFPQQQEGTKAIVVDFINYIGTINGISYKLQTSDLDVKISKE